MNIDQDILRLAAGYDQKGYTVKVRPRPEDMPEFARDLRFEILCRRGDGGVLVAVRVNQQALADDPDILDSIDVVNAQPGWRVDLAIVRGTDPRVAEGRGAEEFSDAAANRSLELAAELARAGHLDAALLAAWPALETGMRRSVRAAGRPAEWGEAPQQMAAELHSSGYLYPGELELIRSVRVVRDLLASGFTPPPHRAEVLTADTLRRLDRIARRLLTAAYPEEIEPAEPTGDVTSQELASLPA